MARPVIGMNVDFALATKSQPAWLRLSPSYAEAIWNAGGMPVIMPLCEKDADIGHWLDLVDGFVLTGGGDLDPRRQGLPKHHAVIPMPDRRESHDRRLAALLIKRKIPTLAIGVGMQLVNVLTGGSLYMHLPEDMQKSMPHVDTNDTGMHRHLVRLSAGSRFESVYGQTELLVNSAHHQAVRHISSTFQIAATAPDGVIEAIESIYDEWYCLATQWHPEIGSALDRQLFSDFLEHCGQSHSVPKLRLVA